MPARCASALNIISPRSRSSSGVADASALDTASGFGLAAASSRSAVALSSRAVPKMLRGPENSSADRSSVCSGASPAQALSAAPCATNSDVTEKGPFTPTDARSSATPGRFIAAAMPPMRASSGSVDPTSSTSASPTSHSVPSGNTDRNVATIDRRSALLMS